jgi:hypothetical protein
VENRAGALGWTEANLTLTLLNEAGIRFFGKKWVLSKFLDQGHINTGYKIIKGRADIPVFAEDADSDRELLQPVEKSGSTKHAEPTLK